MDEATEHVRALARRVVAAALELGPLRAALLAGSGARGDADRYSDVDLLLYVDEPVEEGRLERLCEALGGERLLRLGPELVQFEVGGVAVQVVYYTLARLDDELDTALVRHEEVIDSPNQKLLSGLLEGLVLYGEDVVAPRRERAEAYPEPLRRAAIEQHWQFFPLWYYGPAMAGRDAELWRLDMLLDASFNLLGVLAALNRVWYARFQLKRVRAFEAKLRLAPPRLADRLESLFALPPDEAADELARLVVETKALVEAELPDLELPLRRGPGERLQPWSL